jgi:CheY-like chemotaxis protein
VLLELEDNCYPIVLLDASLHPKYSQYRTVREAPYFKFYASMPIVVEGVCVGGLCIGDTQPKSLFCVEDRMNLMDLAYSISILLQQRRLDFFSSIFSVNRLISLGLIHSLKSPLHGLKTTVNDMMKIGSGFRNSIQDVDIAVSQLSTTISSETFTTTTTVNISSKEESTTVIGMCRHLQDTIPVPVSNTLTTWTLDALLTNPHASTKVEFVDSLSGFLSNILTHIVLRSHHAEVSLNIGLIPADNRVFNGIDRAKLADIILQTSLRLSGTLEVVIQAYGYINNYIDDGITIEMDLASEADFCLNSEPLRNILQSIGVSSRLDLVEESPNEKYLEPSQHVSYRITMPCKVDIEQHMAGGVSPPDQISTSVPVSPRQLHIVDMESSSKIPEEQIAVEKADLRVLLVDDSPSIQKLLGKWMMRNKCVVTSALNGLIGLQYLKQNTYDLVFMDFLMPVMVSVFQWL